MLKSKIRVNQLKLLMAVVGFLLSFRALAIAEAGEALDPSPEIMTKILAAGVNETSLKRILSFIDKNAGQEFNEDVYVCKPLKPASARPGVPTAEDYRTCDESEQEKTIRQVTFQRPRYVVSIDFSKPSSVPRFYFIDLQTGDVEVYLTTHGRGSGQGLWAHKFSNIKNSEQSSLGIYLVGPAFKGSHGDMLRLYGLERSNDQAYRRDIVIHQATYAEAEFLKKINPATKAPYNRLGLSWGCPALAPMAMTRLFPFLRTGAIIDFYHPDLMKLALSGQEVSVPEPQPQPQPTPAPPRQNIDLLKK